MVWHGSPPGVLEQGRYIQGCPGNLGDPGPPSLKRTGQGAAGESNPWHCSIGSIAAMSLEKGHEAMEYKEGIVGRKPYETGIWKS